ncbi:MAG: D-alanyl-D-alanine carboxypeptidase/D-alanyl-D-alanine-endopeptidase [Cytophagaceae bacterium]|nr:D-alanyl-D-alanine carboxypeptidase/D-alanyl-D-alanine-endopeptidase [Cytophagaceae bacterium]
MPLRFLFLFPFFLTGPLLAQSPDSLRRERFRRQIDSLQASPLLQNGSVGACLKNVKTGQTLIAYNARRSLPPASTIKLITTATAMAVLSDTFAYQTTLEYDGQLRGDTLLGSLRIRGVGDPSLASGRFAGFPDLAAQISVWVAAVRQAGIRVVTGRVLADDLFFGENPTPGGWPWDDLGNYYGAGATGLIVNENLYKVFFKPADTLFQTAQVLRTDPVVPYLSFDNRVRTDAAGTGDQVNIFAGPFDRRAYLEGFVPAGVSEFSVKGSLPEPGYFAALSLQTALTQAGLKVAQEAVALSQLRRQQADVATPPATSILHKQASPSLRDLARECNFQSINLYAEAFLKTVGVTLNYGNSTSQGVNALKQVWRSKGVALTGFRPLDGSGLSPQNGVTAQNMVDILTAATREPSFGSFYASIPILGVSGTVRNLGRKTRAAGNVRAKSGSIGGVRAYAGYFTNRVGELVAFCYFFNQYDAEAGSATRELEKLMVRMVEF